MHSYRHTQTDHDRYSVEFDLVALRSAAAEARPGTWGLRLCSSDVDAVDSLPALPVVSPLAETVGDD